MKLWIGLEKQKEIRLRKYRVRLETSTDAGVVGKVPSVSTVRFTIDGIGDGR